MAAFKDLLKRVTDPTLRGQLEEEFKRATKNKKFGLVFEEHRPEYTALYGVTVKAGMSAVVNGEKDAAVLKVLSVKKDIASCFNAADRTMEEHPVGDLVAVAQFEDPIFPVLTPVDEIENAPGDPLWHTLIQADNYHALQLLEYMYRGKVDCIYIDPPYNTGAHDWKYNNDYVDEKDQWRHSKWLSMIEKRLCLARVLLNPKDSVLIVTIDEKEYLHLGMLLEHLYPDSQIQMISSVINPAGAGKPNTFYRTDEYLFYVQLGASKILPESRNQTNIPVIWDTLRRSNARNTREHTNSQFFPIYVDDATRIIKKIGDPYPKEKPISAVSEISGCTAVFPIRDDGTEMMWGCTPDELKSRLSKGFVRVGRQTKELPQKYVISYLTSGIINDIESGKAIVSNRNADGSVNAFYPNGRDKMPTTNWNRPFHDAQRFGSELLKGLIGNRFSYPKSLYAVRDCLKIILADRRDALVLDFFAGSGTTLHAVNLLNAEDGGHRRCILVTNNEVSEAEEKSLKAAGHRPGDDAWEDLGIAKHVTWPRTKCSILGQNIGGAPLDGEYQTNVPCEKKLPRTFYQLGFVKDFFGLSADQKKKIAGMIGVPVGMKKLLKEVRDFPDAAQKILAGAAMPKADIDAECKFVVSNESSSSILFDESAVDDWIAALGETEQVTDLYVVAEKKQTFDAIRKKVGDALGDVTVASTKTIPMADGFKANAKFFKLDFVDKDSVRLGRQFKGILPILWMRSGAKGKCPQWNKAGEPEMMVRPENGFAVLVNYDRYAEFVEAVNGDPKIRDVYFVTDSEDDYREMCTGLRHGKKPTHLYHSYLENFVIGCRRNAK